MQEVYNFDTDMGNVDFDRTDMVYGDFGDDIFPLPSEPPVVPKHKRTRTRVLSTRQHDTRESTHQSIGSICDEYGRMQTLIGQIVQQQALPASDTAAIDDLIRYRQSIEQRIRSNQLQHTRFITDYQAVNDRSIDCIHSQ